MSSELLLAGLLFANLPRREQNASWLTWSDNPGKALAMYHVVVAVTVLVHFGFLCYVIVGGLLALRWRRTIWLHAPAVVWGIAITVGHFNCPLTWLERWGRAKAGMAPLPPEGFIAHYVIGVLYPASWAGAVPIVIFALVLISWALYAWGRAPISANDEP
jgi:hypothetical protein